MGSCFSTNLLLLEQKDACCMRSQRKCPWEPVFSRNLTLRIHVNILPLFFGCSWPYPKTKTPKRAVVYWAQLNFIALTAHAIKTLASDSCKRVVFIIFFHRLNTINKILIIFDRGLSSFATLIFLCRRATLSYMWMNANACGRASRSLHSFAPYPPKIL